jgi:hypothetical protein
MISTMSGTVIIKAVLLGHVINEEASTTAQLESITFLEIERESESESERERERCSVG